MQNELIIILCGFILTLIGIMTPIIKLNSAITKLTCSIDTLNLTTYGMEKELKEVKSVQAKHGIKIEGNTHDIEHITKEIESLKERRE